MPASGSMMSDPSSPDRLDMSREPQGLGPKAASKGTVGDVALMDAVFLVAACWVIVIVLMLSLNSHNV